MPSMKTVADKENLMNDVFVAIAQGIAPADTTTFMITTIQESIKESKEKGDTTKASRPRRVSRAPSVAQYERLLNAVYDAIVVDIVYLAHAHEFIDCLVAAIHAMKAATAREARPTARAIRKRRSRGVRAVPLTARVIRKRRRA